MPRYAAFLRGINVGGAARVKKDDLCAPFTALGFESVTTFRASGNVIFDAGRAPSAELASQIEERLAGDLGFTRAITFIRTAAEMRALAAARPFTLGPGQKMQVMLLLEPPPEQVLGFASADDQLALGPREVFWLPKARLTDSALDLKAIDKLAGPSTMRTKGTLEEISARYFA